MPSLPARALDPLRILAIAALVLRTAFLAHAVHAAPPPGTPTATVDITKFAFAPKDLTIAPGTRVVWTNRDEAPHTVSGNDRTFASKGMDTGDTFEHVFAAEGDFPYLCTVHPFMTGVVHVRKP